MQCLCSVCNVCNVCNVCMYANINGLIKLVVQCLAHFLRSPVSHPFAFIQPLIARLILGSLFDGLCGQQSVAEWMLISDDSGLFGQSRDLFDATLTARPTDAKDSLFELIIALRSDGVIVWHAKSTTTNEWDSARLTPNTVILFHKELCFKFDSIN